MADVTEWGLWIAGAALMAGAGKFYDDYHVDSHLRDRVRTRLVAWYLYLDAPQLRDVGRGWLNKIGKLIGGRTARKMIVGGIASYVLLTFLFWIWPVFTGLIYGWYFAHTPHLTYFEYLLTWVSGPRWFLWALVVLIAILTCWCSLESNGRLLHRWNSRRSYAGRGIVFLIGVLSSAGIILLSGILNVVLGTLIAQHYSIEGPAAPMSAGFLLDPAFAALLATTSAFPSVLLMSAMFGVLLIGAALRITTGIFRAIFDAASSPEKSPFAYATSALAVLVLAFKILETALAD